ncbi:ABC transporter ATP-binding protein [Evansella sp. AB-P1]|uniref:ABC transporter ATP-binding protein n=1 Tax=Evansella sp. AB-P1 TaxID=3037653 RepID=UPI00241E06B6|nr:ABC transporter ATP-binding protein [Evansella sp. AB-P1]MDG5788389.1 ABC transporter ATP-binding protein [Evansella sp. AB-P1]
MIKIHSLSKKYRDNVVLDDIHLTIENGLFGLLGPNGAGKTTLMRILATLLPASSGTVEVGDNSLTKKPDIIRKQLGYLPQYFQIYPQLTAIEFLDYVGVMKGVKKKEARVDQIHKLLQSVNLSDVANKKVKTFSGGMKQRLGIAQALMGDPSIVIIDEPTAGLDPEERVRFRNLLSRISINRIVILSTHIVADIESSCDQLAVLHKGKLKLTGDVDTLRKQAEGKVWLFETDEKTLLRLDERKIISSKRSGSNIQLKLVSDEKPAPDATSVEPSLEDGYIALIGGSHNV